VNFDFVPGERVLFSDDFSKDNVGDLPKRLVLEHAGVASSWPHLTFNLGGKREADRSLDQVVFMTWDGNSDMSGGGVFAALGRANKILIMFDASTDAPAYFANFRVAAGGRKLNDAIAENGRVATQGIYFDTGSDQIPPESAPTLKEIASMLSEHGDLELTIEGHTGSWCGCSTVA
jgi:hypothetical protein